MSAAPNRLEPDSIAAWRDGSPVTRASFAQHVEQVARMLPDTRWIVNRCANRYHFALAFLAACRRGATNLLPPGESVQARDELLERYPGAWLIEDPVVNQALLRPAAPASENAIADEHLAAVVFTSGSTGKPRAHAKSWRSLVTPAGHCRQRLGDRALNVVATVPPQHMFGLETSIVTMLALDWALHDSHAFYPDEIVAALKTIPPPRLLITTPFHLRHLLASTLELPPVDLVLSATAPLARELAVEAERRLDAHLYEIYGCTEAGSMATRRTAISELWTPHPGVRFSASDEATTMSAAYLPEEIRVGDRIALEPDGRFALLGRDADMIKIGGRRGSLADIAAKIASLPGVTDQVVFMPAQGEIARPAALIVAPGRSPAELRRELSGLLDAVFVPRPLRVVTALPRDELGKLPRDKLLALLASAAE
jgi:acyl-coenzyme A synthetase/AMP-(fatty) acid ligase